MHHKFDSCRDHWICFIIHSRDGKVLVLDSTYYEPSKHATFKTILIRAVSRDVMYNFIDEIEYENNM
jgi:hypothetical protein